MSAAAVGSHMPPRASLDDLTAMSAADPNGHRYEISPEGVLSVMPPADVEHATMVSRIMLWLAAAGWPAERLIQNVGIQVVRGDRVGGRIPDLTLWSAAPRHDDVWAAVTGLLVAVEIVSPGSEAMDLVTKRGEYAATGIPHYWVVERDPANTVTLCRLADGTYEDSAQYPLAWLLNSAPDDHLG